MYEDDYIVLNNILLKLRVIEMKKYGDMHLSEKEREKALKKVNKIDYLRNNTELIIKKEV